MTGFSTFPHQRIFSGPNPIFAGYKPSAQATKPQLATASCQAKFYACKNQYRRMMSLSNSIVAANPYISTKYDSSVSLFIFS